ncbi:uncharacterized protein BJ171DRAFT_171860 [Polychytrium aggregatum]|uniref:uncharacterized protein n=1 Tax=Polychytrium aggregatum TaxID=110093 RepID=UPI0022FDDFE9|nr:uncharacterized protein BJ171DRAFT_171860 [Polychytrium aggregatum]KAI9208945.1 hypothetical protein BJ171DRAFT_171860 [Polychytrium aggregatum]
MSAARVVHFDLRPSTLSPPQSHHHHHHHDHHRGPIRSRSSSPFSSSSTGTHSPCSVLLTPPKTAFLSPNDEEEQVAGDDRRQTLVSNTSNSSEEEGLVATVVLTVQTESVGHHLVYGENGIDTLYSMSLYPPAKPITYRLRRSSPKGAVLFKEYHPGQNDPQPFGKSGGFLIDPSTKETVRVIKKSSFASTFSFVAPGHDEYIWKRTESLRSRAICRLYSASCGNQPLATFDRCSGQFELTSSIYHIAELVIATGILVAHSSSSMF